MRTIVALAIASASAVACAELIGIGDVPTPLPDAAAEAGSGDAQSADAGMDTSVPPFDAAGCDACGPSVVPSGWTPVIYSTTGGACPAGFGSEQHGKTDAFVASGACTCYPTDEVPPSCVNGTFALSVDCMGAPLMVSVGDGGCAPLSATIGATNSAPPLASSGGSCKAAATTNTSKLSTVDTLTCVPLSCPDALCATGAAPAGFTACIETDGDQACPAGAFATKHALADGYALECSSACTTCDASAPCTSAVITLYDSCGGSFITSLVADGSCHASGLGTSVAVGGATYAAGLGSPSYVAGGSLLGTAIASGPKTVCCR